ncbi:MAG: hypothetical protein IKK16_05265, partial [Bacteroidaceae bacterium]|nr:hypothetical protein [Bacteroidaceae bacterium]
VKGERRHKSNLFEYVFSEPHPILSKYSERREKCKVYFNIIHSELISSQYIAQKETKEHDLNTTPIYRGLQ